MYCTGGCHQQGHGQIQLFQISKSRHLEPHSSGQRHIKQRNENQTGKVKCMVSTGTINPQSHAYDNCSLGTGVCSNRGNIIPYFHKTNQNRLLFNKFPKYTLYTVCYTSKQRKKHVQWWVVMVLPLTTIRVCTDSTLWDVFWEPIPHLSQREHIARLLLVVSSWKQTDIINFTVPWQCKSQGNDMGIPCL